MELLLKDQNFTVQMRNMLIPVGEAASHSLIIVLSAATKSNIGTCCCDKGRANEGCEHSGITTRLSLSPPENAEFVKTSAQKSKPKDPAEMRFTTVARARLKQKRSRADNTKILRDGQKNP